MIKTYFGANNDLYSVDYQIIVQNFRYPAMTKEVSCDPRLRRPVFCGTLPLQTNDHFSTRSPYSSFIAITAHASASAKAW